MTKDEVSALARDAAFHTPVQEAELIRFAALVAAYERGECAKVCDEHARKIHGYDKHEYAAAIRDRSRK